MRNLQYPFALLLLLLCNGVYAQTHRYQYSHDAAGNRASRTYQANAGAKSVSAERKDTLKVEEPGNGIQDNAEEDSLSSSLWEAHKQKDTIKYGPLMKTQAEKDAYDSQMVAEAMKVVPFKAQEGASLRSSTSYSVGEIPLQYGVSGSGARTYSVPIFTAPDIKYSPSLSLVYNSQGGYGYGGYGWDLAGLSSITLVGKSLYWDGEIKAASAFDKNGVFSLDGVRLVINEDTATATDYPLVTASGHILAAPRCNQSGFITSFTVLYPDGTVAEYGTGINSTYTALIYPIIRTTNNLGEKIEYTYTYDTTYQNTVNPAIARISYGFNTGGEASARIEFEKTYNYTTSYYYAGKKVARPARINAIKSYSGNQLLFKYILSYQNQDATPLLKSISLSNHRDEQLPPLFFTYGMDSPPHSGADSINVIRTISVSDATPFSCIDGFIVRRGKFVKGHYGDGLVGYSNYETYSQTGTYEYECSYPASSPIVFGESVDESITWDSLPAGGGFLTAEAVDINGDGLDEVIRVCNSSASQYAAGTQLFVDCFHNNSGILIQDTTIIVSLNGIIENNGYYSPYRRTFRWGDFLGNGTVQLLSVSYNNNGFNQSQDTYISLIDPLSRGLLFESFSSEISIAPSQDKRLLAIDIDGDSRTEMCFASADSLFVYRLSPYGYTLAKSYPNIPTNVIDSECVYYADINADGYIDIIQSPSPGYNWTFRINTGTNFVKKTMSIIYASDQSQFMFMDIDRDGYQDLVEVKDTVLNFYNNINGIAINGSPRASISINNIGHILPANALDNTSMSSFVTINSEYLREYGYTSYVPPLRHLVQSTDSYGKVIRNTYGYLPSSSAFWTTNPTDIDNDAGYQLRVLPIYVLTGARGFLSEESTSQVFLSDMYSWFDPVVHIYGLGFCGFKKTRTTSYLDGYVHVTFSQFDPQKRGVPLQVSQHKYSEGYPAHQTTTYSWDDHSTTYGKLAPRLTQTISTSTLSGITTTVSYTYDSFDYPTKVITRKSTASATPMPSAVETQYIHSNNTSLYVLGTVASQTTLSSKSLGTPSAMGSRKVFSYDTLLRPVKSETYRVTSTVPAHVATAAYCTSYHATTERWQYDAHGNVIREESAPSGSLVFTGSSYAYDAEGRHLVSSTDPLGHTTAYSDFDIYGNPATVTSHKGQQTHVWRDGWGRTTRTVHPDGTVDSLARAWGGTALYRETARSSGAPEVLTDYDAAGRQVLQMQRRLNTYLKKVQTQYNSRGQVSRVSLPYRYSSPSYWTTYAYDEYGRPTRIAEPSGKTTTWSYSGTSVTEHKEGIRTVRTTNAAGLLTSVADSLSTISYTYRDDGQPSSVTTSTGATTTFTYDTLGRRTSIVDPSAGTRGYMYYTGTGGAQTVTESTPLGTTSTTSDRFGRTVSVTRPDFSSTYSYDEEGRLTAVVSTNGTCSRYTYDVYDRPLSVKDSVPDGKWLRKDYAYNADGNVASIAYTSQGGYITTESYSYSGGINTAVTLPDGTDVYRLTAENAFGQPTSASSGSVTRTYGYSTYGLPTYRKLNGGSLQNFSYSFTPATGNLAGRSSGSTYELFSYDNLGRLTAMGSNAISYDADNNITSIGGVGTMEYTSSSNPYRITELNASSTAPTGTSSQTITYNAYDRPDTITQGGKTASFTYDAGHQRVKMLVATPGEGDLTRYYIGGRYEIEEDGENGMTTENLYLGGDAYTAPMVLQRKGSLNWIPYVIGRDHLGSITHIAATNGTKMAEYSYDAWGRMRNPSTFTVYSASAQPKLFLGRGWCGHEHLKDFGLINMNARLYDPVLGRFLSPDPYIQAPDLPANFNRYAYCLNNPLKYTDLSGEILGIDDMFLAALIGSAIGIYSGGVLANSGQFNPLKWDWNNPRTYGYMLNGGAIGFIGGYLGNTIATSGIPMAKTVSIMASSLSNSLWTNAYTFGQTPISISFGIASYDFSNKEWGYFGKKGNKWYNNLLYFLGMMSNINDINNLIDYTPVNLYTQIKEPGPDGELVFDPISHTGIADSQKHPLMSYGPNGFFKEDDTVPSSYFKFGLMVRPGNMNYPIPFDYSLMSKGFGVNSLLFSLVRSIGRNIPYQGISSNCVNWASFALWLNGIPNIGLHPFLLHGSISVYATGIYNILSYGYIPQY